MGCEARYGVSDRESRTRKIEQGRLSTVVAATIVSYVVAMRHDRIKRITNMARAGKMDHDKMVLEVGGLVALDDLEATLMSDQAQGNVAAQEEFDGQA